MGADSTLVSVRGIARSYGTTEALRDASLDLYRGEIHGLVGENGAGKSTLVRIIAGIEEADAGTIQHGQSPAPRIAIVPQYPRMAAELSVWENLVVGDEPRWGPLLRMRRARQLVEQIAEGYDIALDVEKPAGALGGTELRLAALLAALVHEPDVLVLDEPTVGLAATDQEAILQTLRRFRDDQRSILYISHDLNEVCALAERVTPLVAGRTREAIDHPDPGELAALLFGRDTHPGTDPPDTPDPPDAFHRQTDATKPDALPTAPSTGSASAAILRLEEAVLRSAASGRSVGPVTLELRAGQVAALTGVRESGLDLVEQYLAGEAELVAGTIRLAGRRLSSRVEPARLRHRGLAFVPSDRFDRAAALTGSVEENAIVQERGAVHPRGLRLRGGASGTTRRLLDVFGLRVSRFQPLSALSGGTIQKLILARELDRAPQACVISEPTAGLDLRSQQALRDILQQLAQAGSAVLLLSSSISAAQTLAGAVHVLHGGQLVGSFAPDQSEAIARAFAGIIPSEGCP